MPLPVAIFLPLAFLGFGAVLFYTVRSDRKRGFTGDKPDLSWIGRPGRCASSVVVDARLDMDGALGIAQKVVCDVGGTDIRIVDGTAVVGWTKIQPVIGWFFGWAPQQLAIAVGPGLDGDATVRFWCCSRTRFGIALSDVGRSGQLARQMADRVDALASRSSV
jgi:hypothetical protein